MLNTAESGATNNNTEEKTTVDCTRRMTSRAGWLSQRSLARLFPDACRTEGPMFKHPETTTTYDQPDVLSESAEREVASKHRVATVEWRKTTGHGSERNKNQLSGEKWIAFTAGLETGRGELGEEHWSSTRMWCFSHRPHSSKFMQTNGSKTRIKYSPDLFYSKPCSWRFCGQSLDSCTPTAWRAIPWSGELQPFQPMLPPPHPPPRPLPPPPPMIRYPFPKWSPSHSLPPWSPFRRTAALHRKDVVCSRRRSKLKVLACRTSATDW